MSRLKQNQLEHIKKALNEQLTKEIEDETNNTSTPDEEQEVKLSRKDIKDLYKSSASVEEIKPTKSKQLKKIKSKVRYSGDIPKMTVSWHHAVGDLVRIPKKVSRLDADGYGIIVNMSDQNVETKIHDSRSLVFSPVGRHWYYTKNLRKI
jgi:hypothetical protein